MQYNIAWPKSTLSLTSQVDVEDELLVLFNQNHAAPLMLFPSLINPK
ncbi:hypothetical protein BFV96_4249 [Alteromonas macleodii]|nr:hypothetical protein BFV96_4249 [Alteromonas macleodii]